MIPLIPPESPSAGPSRTSILVAAARAFGAREPDPSVRNPDSLAQQLIGPQERLQIQTHPLNQALDETYEKGLENPEVAGIVRLMMARTRFFDERLLRAVEQGASQVVILGAGFDSRAYRLNDALSHVKFFELDTAGTQQYKMRRMSEVLGVAPLNLVYQPVDFRTDTLESALERAGCQRGVPTIFCWEGVSMYIPEVGVRKTLLSLASYGAPGSTLVMDYTTQSSIDALRATQEASQFRFAANWGEPWLFGVPDGAEEDFFHTLGFHVRESLRMVSPEATRRYATRQDGTIVGTSVGAWQGPNQGARWGYTLVELRTTT